MEDTELIPYRAKKKRTKKWCKGKTGVKHVFEIQRYPKNYARPYADVEVCINCGKHGDIEFDFWKEPLVRISSP